jgi:hypothetical protein
MFLRSPSRRRRLGLSLAELAFVLAVMGVVLGAIWLKAGAIFRNNAVREAVEELHQIAQNTRQMQNGQKIEAGQPVSVNGLSPLFLGKWQGKDIVYNPWRGRIGLLPGNAISWGADTYNAEFTLAVEGVPRDACAPLVAEAAKEADAQIFGLAAVYISPERGKGKELCLASDVFCKSTVPAITEDMAQPLCSAHNPVTVMFTYNLR